MKKTKIDWVKAFQPLFRHYKGRHHPLQYKNHYQLILMVVLSARGTDAGINKLAPALFDAYPNFESLVGKKAEELYSFVKTSPGYKRKAQYLVEIAEAVKKEKNIPKTIQEFLKLSGVGRKSANVIMSEMGLPLEGVIVDLHTIRVTERLGITTGYNPEKIEKSLMEIFPQKYWGILGMSLTYLGRELCRPTDPNCEECKLNSVCAYYKANK